MAGVADLFRVLDVRRLGTAYCWLRLLASEGYSPSDYLEEEIALRARDMRFTHTSVNSVGYGQPTPAFLQNRGSFQRILGLVE